jgi:hypothetical protein
MEVLRHPRHVVVATVGAQQRNMGQHTLISFIWSPGNPLPAGTGGSENYTIGQVRELTRRGIPAQVVTVGLGVDDGRDDFTDTPFLSLSTLTDVGALEVGCVEPPAAVPPVGSRTADRPSRAKSGRSVLWA